MNGRRERPPVRNGCRSGGERAATAAGAVVGAAAVVGWSALAGMWRWCNGHRRTTAVVGSVVIGAWLGGFVGALLLVYGFLLGLWWVLVSAPEAVAKAFGRHPNQPDGIATGSGRVLGPARACPACGGVHSGDVWLIGPDPQGVVHCVELPQGRGA